MRSMTMYENRQVEFDCINTGFPYTITENFMDLFEGLTYGHSDFPFAVAMHDQENAYWPMHLGFYEFSPWDTPYYGRSHAYEVDDHRPVMDRHRRAVENFSRMNNRDQTPLVVHEGGSSSTVMHASPEECIRIFHNVSNSQDTWQGNVDPDNMTYEELLDLGEAVGTHSRGLSKELISLLPISKFKCNRFFSRKKSRERCVICQMEYKRREQQITLPCKHVYHADCGTRWLGINKACPVCYTEVFGEDSRHQTT